MGRVRLLCPIEDLKCTITMYVLPCTVVFNFTLFLIYKSAFESEFDSDYQPKRTQRKF